MDTVLNVETRIILYGMKVNFLFIIIVLLAMNFTQNNATDAKRCARD